MRTLRILHTDSSTGLGGEEFRILSESVGMARRGHAVVLAVNPKGKIREYADRYGIPVEPVTLRKSLHGPLVFRFLTLIDRYGVDIVNTHSSVDSWDASIAGRLSRRKPLVIRTRHKCAPISNGLEHRILYKVLPHAIITTGQSLREELIRQQGIHPSRILSIPTGVDLQAYSPEPLDGRIRAQFGLSRNHLLIGTVAFFRHYKGLDQLLTAFKHVTRDHPETRLLIVGDGPERSNVERQIIELGLSDSVILAGYREDVPNMLAAINVFVLASIEGEGLPQALTQAMAMERPAIATSVGSISEVITDQVTGLLVPPREPSALAQGMSRLIRDNALREAIARNGRDLIVKKYSLETMLNKTENFYQRMFESVRAYRS